MKQYEGNVKKYEGIYGKYEGNITKYIGRRTWKNFGSSSRGRGNLTRTQFLGWPPVPNGKAGLPPKKTWVYETPLSRIIQSLVVSIYYLFYFTLPVLSLSLSSHYWILSCSNVGSLSTGLSLSLLFPRMFSSPHFSPSLIFSPSLPLILEFLQVRG